jgi:predicted transcriptional regulator
LNWADPAQYGSVDEDIFFDEVEDFRDDMTVVREYINTLTKEEKTVAIAQLVEYNNTNN